MATRRPLVSYNPRMLWIETYLKDRLVPVMGRGSFYQIRLLKTPSSLASNTPREEVSLGNLFLCLLTLIVNNFFLFKGILPCPAVVCLCENPSPAFLQAPFRLWKAAIRSSCSLPLSRLNNPQSEERTIQFSQSVFIGEGLQPSSSQTSSGLSSIDPCLSYVEGLRAECSTPSGVS